MKVVVAAAGRGSRMLHLTNNKPKHVINVERKPFLYYILINLLKAGYNDLVLVVGYKGEKILDFLADYKLNAEVINQHDVLGDEYGTLCPLKCAKKSIGKENFLMVYADNLYSEKDLKNFNIDDDYNYVAGYEHKNPEKYGVLVSNNGFLKEIIEKPKNPISTLINTGLYKFTPEIFDVIPQVELSPRGEYELTDAISILAKGNKVKIKKIEDYWLDFGCPADIMKLSSFLKENGNGKNKSK